MCVYELYNTVHVCGFVFQKERSGDRRLLPVHRKCCAHQKAFRCPSQMSKHRYLCVCVLVFQTFIVRINLGFVSFMDREDILASSLFWYRPSMDCLNVKALLQLKQGLKVRQNCFVYVGPHGCVYVCVHMSCTAIIVRTTWSLRSYEDLSIL